MRKSSGGHQAKRRSPNKCRFHPRRENRYIDTVARLSIRGNPYKGFPDQTTWSSSHARDTSDIADIIRGTGSDNIYLLHISVKQDPAGAKTDIDTAGTIQSCLDIQLYRQLYRLTVVGKVKI
jgi:hypothetical protein